jgi:hypothetical protein
VFQPLAFAGVVAPQKAREGKCGPEMPPQHHGAVRGRDADETCVEPVVRCVTVLCQGFQECGAIGRLGIEECPVQIEDDRRSSGDCSVSFAHEVAGTSKDAGRPGQAHDSRTSRGEQSQAQRVPRCFGTKPCAPVTMRQEQDSFRSKLSCSRRSLFSERDSRFRRFRLQRSRLYSAQNCRSSLSI